MATVRRFVTARYVSYSDDGEILGTRVWLAVRPVDAFLRADAHGLVLGPDEVRRRSLISEVPLGQLTVRIKERPQIQPIRKEDGFYCFTDLDVLTHGTYTLRVAPESDSGWYAPAERSVIIEAGRPVRVIEEGGAQEIDPVRPAYDLQLQPTPSYPFPDGSTLIRGFAYEKEGERKKPVAGARVSTAFKQLIFDPQAEDYKVSEPWTAETSTDHAGQFLLFFKRFVENKDQGRKARRSGILKKVEEGGNEVDQEIKVEVEKNGRHREKTLPIRLRTRPRRQEDGEGAEPEENNQEEVLKEGKALKLEFEFLP